MIELITGTPGSFKTATAVLELCMTVPGTFVEAQDQVVSHGVTYNKGDQVPRHLFANIKGLLVDHTPIDDEAMKTWHKWAQAGDVIVFDECQTLWRTRSVQKDVPDEIKALETHRHAGVDLALVTQHPMLMDTNVRRLVNRHRHLRRLPGGMVMEYEWDHCGNPGSYKTCIRTGLRRRPSKAFAMYESATLHTKPKTQAPKGLLLLLLVAMGVSAWQGPKIYDRLFNAADVKAAALVKAPAAGAPGAAASAPAAVASAPVMPVLPALPALPAASAPKLAGCIQVRETCRCFDEVGQPMPLLVQECRERLPRGGKPIDLVGLAPDIRQPVTDQEQTRRDLDVWRSLRPHQADQGHGANVLRLMGQTIARPY